MLEISDTFRRAERGAMSTPRPAAGLTVDEIGLMMGGVHGGASRGRHDALVKRPSPSRCLESSRRRCSRSLLTMIVGGMMFALLGKDPLEAIRTIFWDPLFGKNAFYYRSQLPVKAAPLILIAIGLSLGFRAGIWNIGAEGQYIMGAICRRRRRPCVLSRRRRRWIFPLVILRARSAAWSGR